MTPSASTPRPKRTPGPTRPAATRRRTRRPGRPPRPPQSLSVPGLDRLRLDVVAADRLGDRLRLPLARLRQAVEDGHHDVGGVGLEVAAGGGPGVGATLAC